jgi:DNA-binding NarL/FixJ family response regulator
MIQSDEHFCELTDAFHAAAIDRTSWYSALDGLARATGSQSGELICIGSDAAISVNIMTNIAPDFAKAFAKAGGGDPKINPRVRAGMAAPALKVLAESDFITPEEYKRDPHYQEFAIPWDIPFICLSTLERQDDTLIGLAVVRSQRQGHITPKQRDVFAAIAPHVRAAVRTHIALEGNGAAVLAGALEALSIPAFVCDRAGRVNALTPSAEALIQSARGLHLKGGRLMAADPADATLLADAIDHAALGVSAGSTPLKTLIVRSKQPGALPLVLDVIALRAREHEMSFTPRVLVVARGSGGSDERRSAILQAAYRLTTAETEIAVQISHGSTAEMIATRRGVAVGTVRTQIKTILSKMGASRQVELVSRVNQI